MTNESMIKRKLSDIISCLDELILYTPRQTRQYSELISNRDEAQRLLDDLTANNSTVRPATVRRIMQKLIHVVYAWASDDE